MTIAELRFFIDHKIHFNKDNQFDKYILCKNPKGKDGSVLRDHIWVNIENIRFIDPEHNFLSILGTYVFGVANIDLDARNKIIVHKLLIKEISHTVKVIDLGFEKSFGSYTRELFRLDQSIFYTVLAGNGFAYIIEYKGGETTPRLETQDFSFGSKVKTSQIKYLTDFEDAIKRRIKRERKSIYTT